MMTMKLEQIAGLPEEPSLLNGKLPAFLCEHPLPAFLRKKILIVCHPHYFGKLDPDSH
jgi:hypothetical protein